MIKADLRRQFLAERKALPAEEVERRSQAIAERFFSSDDRQAAPIFLNKIGARLVVIANNPYVSANHPSARG